MKLLFLALVGLLVFSSCIEYDDVELVRLSNYRVHDVEGNKAMLDVDVELMNPNVFGIKVKPSTLDLYVENVYAGKVELLEKVKIKRKRTGVYLAQLHLIGEQGILFKMMRYVNKPQITIRLTGEVKGSVYGISKKIKVDKTKVIDPSKLKANLPF